MITQTAVPTPTSLSMRIATLEARIAMLEHRLKITEHGAASNALAEKVIEQVKSPHWVLGEDGGSGTK